MKMPVKKTTTVKQPFWSEKDIKPSLKSKPLNHRQSLANKKSSRPREKMLAFPWTHLFVKI